MFSINSILQVYLMSDGDRNFYTTLICTTAIGVILLIKFSKGKLRELANLPALYVRTTNIIKSIQFVPESIITINYDYRIIYTNNRVKKTFGYTEDELKEANISLIFLDMQGFEKFRKEFSDQDMALLTEVKRKDGTTFPAEVTIGKWMDDDDIKNIFYTIIIRDITHRKKNEESVTALRKEIDKISSLCFNGEKMMGSGTKKWDLASDNVEYTEGFRRIFNLRKGEQVKAVDLIRTVYYEDTEKLNNSILSCMEEGKPFVIEYRVVQPNGTKDLIKEWAEPEFNVNKKVVVINGSVLRLKENV